MSATDKNQSVPAVDDHLLLEPTQPNSRHAGLGSDVEPEDPLDLMDLVKESSVTNQKFSPLSRPGGNRLRKLKLDEIDNASGSQPPSKKKRTRIKSPSASQNQMDLPKRQETRNKSSSTRTKTQDLSTQISDLKTSLASLTSIVSGLTPNSRPRPASNGHNVELDMNVGPVQEVVHSVGQNPLLPPVGGGLPGTHASRIQNPLLPPVGGDFSTARYSRGQGQNSYQPNTAVSSSPVSFHSDWNDILSVTDPEGEFSALFGNDASVSTERSTAGNAIPQDPHTLVDLSEQAFDDELFDELESFYNQADAVGPKVDEKLSKLVNTVLRSKISGDKLKSKAECFKRPQNCENLIVPNVNAEVWRKMSSRAKSRDLNFQRVQLYLTKGLIPMVQCLQFLLNWRRNAKNNADRSVHISDIELSKVTSDLCDSFSLLSHSDYQLCLRRREFIKPELNSEFRSLCASAPITEFLFGNDICSQIKELQQANQLVSRLTQYKQTATGAQRARPYRQFASENAHNRGPFLHGEIHDRRRDL